MIIYIILGTIIVLGVITALFLLKNKKEGKSFESVYKYLAVYGGIWIASSVIIYFGGRFFDIATDFAIIGFIMGWIFLAVGLANRNKWKPGWR
ncbi:hypothetical protein ACFL96_17535 [Thermoproteota archaeon]